MMIIVHSFPAVTVRSEDYWKYHISADHHDRGDPDIYSKFFTQSKHCWIKVRISFMIRFINFDLYSISLS